MSQTKRSSDSLRPPQRVAAALRERILSGQYQPGEWLPAERDLTLELRVHRRVIRAALDLLDADGFVYRRTNCRPVVQLPSNQTIAAAVRPDSGTPASKLIALAMWQGGGAFETHGTAQQRIFWGMNHVLADAGYHVVFLDLGSYGSEEQNAKREAAHLRYVLDGSFGGIVFYSHAYQSNRELIQAVAQTVPLVLIDRTLVGVQADYVGVHNAAAMATATEHLIALGHRRIVYITLPQAINTVQDRLQGYLNALERRFGDDRQEYICFVPEYSVKSWPMFDMLFSVPAHRRPTGIVCVNDHAAVRVLERLDSLKLHADAPADVSIIGFDNVVHKLPNGVGLTTMEQPFEDIGREAARLMLQRIERRGVPLEYVELPCHLILRESTRRIDPEG